MNDFAPVPELEVVTAVPFDIIKEQVQFSSSLGVKPITECEGWRADKHIAIVGGGPSLKENLDVLRRYKYIMACGSVHDYLVRNGIYPNWCVICDPDPVIVDYLKEANIITEYLVASQCHSKVFEHLKHKKTFIWHAGGSKEGNKEVGFPAVDYVVGGGCTVGTRAIIMATCFGYYDIDLFGMDSSIREDAHHSYEFINNTESLGDVYEIKLDEEDSPTFKVAGYMLGQIQDFQKICQIYGEVISFNIYGDGLLAYLLRTATKKAKKQLEVI